jgi:hypothetical protein
MFKFHRGFRVRGQPYGAAPPFDSLIKKKVRFPAPRGIEPSHGRLGKRKGEKRGAGGYGDVLIAVDGEGHWR